MVLCQFFLWGQGSKYRVSVIAWDGSFGHHLLRGPHFKDTENKEVSSEKSVSDGLLIHQFTHVSHDDSLKLAASH